LWAHDSPPFFFGQAIWRDGRLGYFPFFSLRLSLGAQVFNRANNRGRPIDVYFTQVISDDMLNIAYSGADRKKKALEPHKRPNFHRSAAQELARRIRRLASAGEGPTYGRRKNDT